MAEKSPTTPEFDIESLMSSPAVRFMGDAFPAFISYVDSTYRYRFMNKAYENRLGKNWDEMMGQSIDTIWGKELAARIRPNLDRALDGETITVEVPFGDHFFVNTYVPHLNHEQKALGVLVFAQDISELHASRSALIQAEKMAALGRLAASMLHEINNPLGVVKGNNDVIRRMIEKYQTDGMGETLAGIAALVNANETAIVRIAGILNRLEQFTQVDQAEAGRVDLHACLQNTLAVIQPEFGDAVELITDYGSIPLVQGRAGDLNQLFLNLLTNGLEAINKKGRITIRTFIEDREIHIAISDTGKGIPAEALKNLFEPVFNRGGNRVKAGLGLFVCQEIARRHQGRITVDSEPGRGSTFNVILPQEIQ